MPNPLGRMLRLYRAHREITVRELAPAIGVSVATLSRIERGAECDVPTFLKLVSWMRAPERKQEAA